MFHIFIKEWSDENSEKYSGVFRFRFWRFGSWVEVLVSKISLKLMYFMLYVRYGSFEFAWIKVKPSYISKSVKF